MSQAMDNILAAAGDVARQQIDAWEGRPRQADLRKLLLTFAADAAITFAEGFDRSRFADRQVADAFAAYAAELVKRAVPPKAHTVPVDGHRALPQGLVPPRGRVGC